MRRHDRVEKVMIRDLGGGVGVTTTRVDEGHDTVQKVMIRALGGVTTTRVDERT